MNKVSLIDGHIDELFDKYKTCKNCPDRSVDPPCHDNCEGYKARLWGKERNGMQIDVFGSEISATELAKKFQEIEQKRRKRYKPMQELYGLTKGKTCKTCKHCLKIDHHCKTYYKCELWVISNSAATDIRLKNNACGKYESEVDTE